MEKLKKLVELLIDYTLDWSITEDEWYWNVDCVRKSCNINNTCITQTEFEVAIREEFLYDLVYNKGSNIKMQIETDLSNYGDNETLIKTVKKIEIEIKKFIKDFEIEM